MNTVVLHYLNNLALGGTEKTCQLFIKGVKGVNHVLAYKESGGHDRIDEFKSVCDETNTPMLSLASPDDLQAIIDDHSVDILHVYRGGSPEYPEPDVHVSVPHFIETNAFGLLSGNPAIDKTLFMSKWLMDNTIQKFGFRPNKQAREVMQRFDFVNNPVEEPFSKDKLDVPEGRIVLGRIGRQDNGIYNAVAVKAAHALLLKGYPIFFLCLAAPSNMISDLEDFGIPYRNIEPTCDPEIISKFYNTIDIHAHARADGETCGLCIAESMMHEKPVVTHVATPSFAGMTVFQSQTTLVVHGETGFVSDNDHRSYQKHLINLIDSPDLRSKMGKAGKEKIMAEYHIDVCCEKLSCIYEEVVSE